MGECQRRNDSQRRASASSSSALYLIECQEGSRQEPRETLATVPHDVVMVDLEDRLCHRGQQVHPGAGGLDVPLIEHGGHPVLLEEAPPADARQLAARVALQQSRAIDLGRAHEELESVGELRLPDVAPVLADAGLIALLELLGLEHALPPMGPALG